MPDARDGRVARIYLVAVVDPPGVLTLLRVERRDWMDRLIAREQFSPLTGGGHERVISTGLEHWSKSLMEVLEALEAQPE